MNLSLDFSDKLVTTFYSIDQSELMYDNDLLNNNSDNTTVCELYKDEFVKNVAVVMTIVWSLIAVVGVLANGCVLVVMLNAPRFTSATQYFIINLSLSDLLFLLICPTFSIINYNDIIIYDHLPHFIGSLICKLDYFSTHLTVFITCLTLMSMTFDRYLVIMHPLKALSYRSKTKAILINIIIWILSFTLSLPLGYFRELEVFNNESKICTTSSLLESNLNLLIINLNLGQFFILYTIIISYIIPLCTIVLCYLVMIKKLSKEKALLNDSVNRRSTSDQQKRRRVLIMIGIVTLMFGLSWFPIHSILFGLKFKKEFPVCSKLLYAFKAIAHTLTYMNSMLNPFFYTIMGNNFRKQVFEQKAKYSSRLKSYYSRNNSCQDATRINNQSQIEMNAIINPIQINGNNNNNSKKSIRNFHSKKSFQYRYSPVN